MAPSSPSRSPAGHATRSPRLTELGESRRRAAVRDRVFEEMLNSFNLNAVHLGTGLVLLLGAQAISEGTFTVGDLALFVVYLDQLTWYPAEIGRLISDLKRMEVSFGRMQAIVPGEAPTALVAPAPVYLRGAPPEPPPPPPRERLEVLELRHLTHAHPDGACGITDVSFALERGSFTVITGRIGAGKTTLLHVLLGLLPRDAGEVRWNGRLVDDPATFFVPPRSAYTPQVPRLFSETLRETCCSGARRPARARRGDPRGGHGARPGGARARARHADRTARREALGRPGPAGRCGADVRARRRVARLRRPLLGPRRRDGGGVVEAALHAGSRLDLPGRLAPSGGAAPG
ncbi:MAG: ATP-binding cassette domain-containing protein [Chloroflexia bacterium]